VHTRRLTPMSRFDAVVVGAGPNGLAAAISLARAGCSVLVREAAATPGGGARSCELTLPGYIHDLFSAIHPLSVGSPFLRRLPLEEHGLEWVHSPAPLAHPFDDGSAVLLERSVAATAEGLGREGRAYSALIGPIATRWPKLAREILQPLHLSRSSLSLARFGLDALLPASLLARHRLGGGRAAALFAGSAAHGGVSLGSPASAAFGLVLHAAGHAVGWPLPRGGAGRLTAAMAGYLISLGGRIETGNPVGSLDELPPSRAILLDLTARQVAAVGRDYLPERYLARLRRFRYGAGVFKVDWALSGPIPWRAAECGRAATVHLGGPLEEIVASLGLVARSRIAERPFVLLAQPTLFDPTRAPQGSHVAWAYCHVPNGSSIDMLDRIERQIERFAPGFRELVVARSVMGPEALERMNANLVGGDVNGGAAVLGQILFRPTVSMDPYSTPVPGVYICSASTPPGGGVHGMCGYNAARSALRNTFGLTAPLRI